MPWSLDWLAPAAAGVRAVALHADLSHPDAAISLARHATEAVGPIDVLIPNAGVSVRTDLARVDLTSLSGSTIRPRPFRLSGVS